MIIRSFPVSALHSIKKLGLTSIHTVFPATVSIQSKALTTSKGKLLLPRGLDRCGLTRFDDSLYVLNIRSLTMQMVRLGFDLDDVTMDTVDALRHVLERLRYPESLQLGFNPPPRDWPLEVTKTLLTKATSSIAGEGGSIAAIAPAQSLMKSGVPVR